MNKTTLGKTSTYEMSLGEFRELFSRKFPGEEESLRDSREEHEGFRARWYEHSLAQAQEYFRTGYEVNTLELNSQAEELSERLCESLQFRRDVTGQFFDVGDVIAGVPEAWFEIEQASEPYEAHVWINITTTHYISQEQYFNRGLVIVSLIKLLQKLGFRVKLKLQFKSIKDSSRKVQHVIVDVPTDPLDIDLLNYALTQVSFYRRLCFALDEVLSEDFRLHHAGATTVQRLGYPPGPLVCLRKGFIRFVFEYIERDEYRDDPYKTLTELWERTQEKIQSEKEEEAFHA